MSLVQIRPTGGGKGVGQFATRAIRAGELILVTEGTVITTAQIKACRLPEHPFQIEIDHLLAPGGPTGEQLNGIFATNHSCSPNAGIRGQVSLVALRDIREGEEICYDYVMTDSDPAGQETFRMSCLCRSPECRKIVTDRDWLDPGLRARYRGYFSSYLAARMSAPDGG